MYIHKSICLNQGENATWSLPVFVSEDQAVQTFQTSHLRNCLLRYLADCLCQSLLVVETRVFSLRLFLEIAIKIVGLFFPLSLVIKNIIFG